MSCKNYLNYFLFAILIIAFVGCKDEDPPTPPKEVVPEVTALNPTTLKSGDMFYITGNHFGTASPNKQIIVGEIPATIAEWSDTQIEASVEIEPGEYQVKMIFPDTTIIAGNLTYIDDEETLPVQISNISPNVVEPGQTIDIEGTSFGNTQGTNFVKIGDISVSEYLLWSDVNIQCKVPEDIAEGIYQVVVVTDGEISNAVELEVKFEGTEPDLAPVINNMTPTTAQVGDEITITGENFGAETSTSAVYIGSVKCADYTTWNNTTIKFVIPEGATSGDVKVHIDSKISNGKFLTIETTPPPDPDNPVITSMDKDHTLPPNQSEYDKNTPARINGEKFGSQKGQVFITLGTGGMMEIPSASILQWNNTTVRVTIPDASASGVIYVVTNDGLKSNEYPIYVAHPDPIKTVFVSKGIFVMGDNSSSNSHESPEHQVTISYDFYMAETPVTRGQYINLLGINPPVLNDNNPECPVIYRTFLEAVRFCDSLSKKYGLAPCYTINGSNITCNFDANGYRLPTGAEWEYVARAGQTNGWGFTSDPSNYTWHEENVPSSGPQPVKTRASNAWGFYDMNGNVDEWCWDNWSLEYYNQCANGVTDPRGSNEYGCSQVIRGGNFRTSLDKCKSTSRNSYGINDNAATIGFRFVRKR